MGADQNGAYLKYEVIPAQAGILPKAHSSSHKIPAGARMTPSSKCHLGQTRFFGNNINWPGELTEKRGLSPSQPSLQTVNQQFSDQRFHLCIAKSLARA
ncbi:MAG: hypothetical protein OEN02_14675, partial [Gammaproteobacteria bacterium]|nr:hypothetical protein [Gammaproteobacteria bacterium]